VSEKIIVTYDTVAFLYARKRKYTIEILEIVKSKTKKTACGKARALLKIAKSTIGTTPIRNVAELERLELILFVEILPRVLFPNAISAASTSVSISPFEKVMCAPLVTKKYVPTSIIPTSIPFLSVIFSPTKRNAKTIEKKTTLRMRSAKLSAVVYLSAKTSTKFTPAALMSPMQSKIVISFFVSFCASSFWREKR